MEARGVLKFVCMEFVVEGGKRVGGVVFMYYRYIHVQ